MIGGISYFHEFAYDLLAENERILAATFDAAVDAFKRGRLKKINVLSAAWSTRARPSSRPPKARSCTSAPADLDLRLPEAGTEYFARGAREQYGLPYTIIRPFNCVGIGERRALRDHDVM